MVEGTTQVITGTIKLAYNRGQQHHTHQHHCILQKIPQIQTSMANRQITILSTQYCDYVLTCCVKMAQQISYAQEVKDLMEQQRVAATSSLKTWHPFITQEGFPTGEDEYNSILP